MLGTVINCLIEGAGNKGLKKNFVPYRDSKITYILKDSIGGNSKTIMIATISENSNSIFETVSTLKFAERAKKIQNRVQINEETSGDVNKLKQEINLLRI